MKSEKYDKMRELVSQIDKLNDSVDLISEVSKSIDANGGTGKLHIYTGVRNYEVEIDSELLKIVLSDILCSYYDFIKEEQKEFNGVVESIINKE